MIETRQLALEGIVEILPRKIEDDRGFFSETYSEKSFRQAGIDLHFVQDKHSLSASRGVLRGLHYQLPPHAQDKL
ncbi:MAG: dTDP-4-dehydrorhamnose 3,5-epimerase family protein, partial [Phyllobacterium sp.]